MTSFKSFWKEEQGQDLIEYALLVAVMALASADLFLGAGSSNSGSWSQTASNLASANASGS